MQHGIIVQLANLQGGPNTQIDTDTTIAMVAVGTDVT